MNDRFAIRYRVLAASVSAVDPQTTLDWIARWIETGAREYLSVCTVHTMLECVDDQEMARIVDGAALALPDGMPLVWLGRLAGHPVRRVYGPDLLRACCEAGLDRGWRHYFYGGKEGVAARLAGRLEREHEALEVAGVESPPFRPLSAQESAATVERIDRSGADIVWVGLGTPKQDRWAARYRPLLRAPVVIPVGAAFDFLAGDLPQAPRWMQRCGLEWAFRLSCEPRRLWRRYLLGNPRFLCLWIVASMSRGRRR